VEASHPLAAANRVWGSDIIAGALREQGIPYVCLVPGASFRGLQDSIVNYLGNETPKILMPAIIIGATGPADAEKCRPWIEWIHTSIDQGALVRDYTKWDDRP
jgi:acetolactate synthase-1/2/3 large subunit